MKWERICGIALLATFLLEGCGTTEESAEQQSEPLLDLSQFEGDEGERCISLSRIKTTKILGDQAIQFTLRNGDVYINILPRRCPSLRPNRILSWETSQSSLCNLDILHVLDRVGVDIQRVGACGLGHFHLLPEGMPVVEEATN
jgi:hypothetical protein